MKRKVKGNILLVMALVMITVGVGLVPFAVIGISQGPAVCNAGFYSRMIGVSETQAKVQFACFHKVQSSYQFNLVGGTYQTHMIPAYTPSGYPDGKIEMSVDYDPVWFESNKGNLYVELSKSEDIVFDSYTYAAQNWKLAKNVGVPFDAETLMNNVNSYSAYAKDLGPTCAFGVAGQITCGSNVYSVGEDVIFFVAEKTISVTEDKVKRAFLFYPTWFETYPYRIPTSPDEFLSNYWGYWDYPVYDYVPGQDPQDPQDPPATPPPIIPITTDIPLSIPLIVGGIALGGVGVYLRRRR